MKFESPFAAGLNFLLDSEPWSRERLAPFAGEALELRLSPLPALRFTVTPEGRLAAPPDVAANPSLVVTVGPDAPAAALKGEAHFLRAIRIEGNARLANEVLFLFRHLRWDVEEEVAKVVGDVAARRVSRLARGVAAWHVDAVQRVAEALVEYATEEKPLLVIRAELDEIGSSQARLRDALERLEKRVDRLGR